MKRLSLTLAAFAFGLGLSAQADESAVAEVLSADGTVVQTFADLAKALAAAPDNGTVRLLADVDRPAEAGKVEHWIKTEGLTFDLNGHRLTSRTEANGLYVATNGVTVKNGTLAAVQNSCLAVWDAYAVAVTNCTFEGVAADSDCFAISCMDGAQVDLRGSRIKTKRLSRGGTGAVVSVTDVTASTALTEWSLHNDNSQARLRLVSGVFPLRPLNTWLADGSLVCDCKLGFVVAPADEIDRYDLAPSVARVGAQFFDSFTKAFWTARDTGEPLVFCSDIELTEATGVNANLTIDLCGHAFRNGTKGGLLMVFSNEVTVVNGTLQPHDGAAFWLRHAASRVTLDGCTVRGTDGQETALGYGEAGSVLNVVSSNAVVETTHLAGAAGGMALNVSNGVVRAASVWLGGTPTEASVRVVGGSWVVSPRKRGVKNFRVARGKLVVLNEETGLFDVLDRPPATLLIIR